MTCSAKQAQPVREGAFNDFFVFLILAALFVFARWFWGHRERWWATYCIVSSILFPTPLFVGQSGQDLTARFLRSGVLIGWGAASLIAVRLMRACATMTVGKLARSVARKGARV